MEKIIVNIKSITYAHKAQKLLLAKGITSNIKKATSSEGTQGCGYSLYINTDNKNVVSFLEKNRIPIASVRNGGDAG
ncbi:MAG: DUF3343 domain-containing protein [Oscillospiraceae bacterium]|nr:DUF3343 domain-containing protein [Oscillospiraceae bacterium]